MNTDEIQGVESGPGRKSVLTMIPNSEVGTARRAVRSRLGEATLPEAVLRPLTAIVTEEE
jgi:hypothetical protein